MSSFSIVPLQPNSHSLAKLCPHTCGCVPTDATAAERNHPKRMSFRNLHNHAQGGARRHPYCSAMCPMYKDVAQECTEELSEEERIDPDYVPNAPKLSSLRSAVAAASAASWVPPILLPPPILPPMQQQPVVVPVHKRVEEPAAVEERPRASPPASIFPPVLAEQMTPAMWTMFFKHAADQAAAAAGKKQ